MHTILVLGGTSSLALAHVKKRLQTLQSESVAIRILLLGRNAEKLLAEKQDLSARGAEVTTHACDLSLRPSVDFLKDVDGKIDEVLLAYGTLTENPQAQTDQKYLEESLTTNFVSATIWLEALAAHFTENGAGKAIIIGSVAGDRGRQSNYVYGAAKAGLATFVRGLQHRFAQHKNISFTLIKPGFVDTQMTAHIQPKGKLWAQPEKVARIMEKAMLRGSKTAYAPFFWRWIMLAITSTPTFIFHKTKL